MGMEADARGFAAAAGVGPFFAVETAAGDGLGPGPGAGWRRLGELTASGDGGASAVAAGDRIATARRSLAERAGVPLERVETRVAGSIVFLGLAARLLSPPLAVLVLAGRLPRWTVDGLWWRPVEGGPWPLMVTLSDAGAGGNAGSGDDRAATGGAAHAYAEQVVRGVVEPALAAFATAAGVSRKIMWGNVASGLVGSAGMIAAARPDLAAAARALAAELLTIEPLAGTGGFAPGPAGRVRFTRRSCCLFYRVPGGGTCADCVLTASRR
jgi:hypothetical protein